MLRSAFDVHLVRLLTGNIPRLLHLPSQPFHIFMHDNLVDLREPVLKSLCSILHLELLVVQNRASHLIGVLLVVRGFLRKADQVVVFLHLRRSKLILLGE